MIAKIQSFFSYLFKKRSEAKELGVKDAMLAKAVLDIHRKKSGSKFITVPLQNLLPIHVIDRPNAIDETKKRAKILKENRESLLQKKVLNRNTLAQLLPSVSWIKVVGDGTGKFISYEGNGRLYALKEAFTVSDNIEIEVEEYYFKNDSKILRRMNRVRKLNGLL